MVSPPRVLVAEDQPLLRWAIGRMLSPLGADVVFASTYQQACDLLSNEEFAAVVLASPLEGRHVSALLRDVDRMRPQTRLLALCASDDAEHVQDDIPRAMVFRKPFPLSELAAVIAPVLGAAHA
jgi:DNA-binding NtrC family response regulator